MRDPATGAYISEAQAIRNVVESIVLAEQVGLDWFGVGEHHTPEFPASAAAPILAAAAAQTSRIKLLHAIELFGTEVRPIVQAELGTTTVDERLGRTPLSPRRDDPGARSPGAGSEPGAASVVRIGA
ncbi:LLM class flavin-dependent oxidoreductase [Blastococcus sp. SYSU DS0617]